MNQILEGLPNSENNQSYAILFEGDSNSILWEIITATKCNVPLSLISMNTCNISNI